MAERDPLAVLAKPFLVDGLEPEEHVLQAQTGPQAEHVLVAEQHVAPGLEVVLLANPAARDGLTDLEAVPGLHEGHVVHDEHAGLLDAAEILHRTLRADHAVAPTVERPRAAERAVPGAAAGELDRRAGIERAEKVPPAVPEQVTGGHEVVQVLHQTSRRPLAVEGDDASHLCDRAAIVLDRFEQREHRRLALALHDAIDGSAGVLEELLRDERGAVAPDEHEGVGPPGASQLRQIDDLGNIRQVVARECHHVRLPVIDEPEVVLVRGRLQIDEPGLVARPADGGRDQLEPEGLEAQEDLRVHQGTGVDGQDSHGSAPHSTLIFSRQPRGRS